jgi:hypothetical protein
MTKFGPRKIDFGFLTLQSCLDEILASNGNNTYKIPHMGKERLLQAETLPVHVGASTHAFNIARQVMVGIDHKTPRPHTIPTTTQGNLHYLQFN